MPGRRRSWVLEDPGRTRQNLSDIMRTAYFVRPWYRVRVTAWSSRQKGHIRVISVRVIPRYRTRRTLYSSTPSRLDRCYTLTPVHTLVPGSGEPCMAGRVHLRVPTGRCQVPDTRVHIPSQGPYTFPGLSIELPNKAVSPYPGNNTRSSSRIRNVAGRCQEGVGPGSSRTLDGPVRTCQIL